MVDWNFAFIVTFSTIFIALFITIIVIMSKDTLFGDYSCTQGPCYWCLNDKAWRSCGGNGNRQDDKLCQQLDWNECKTN